MLIVHAGNRPDEAGRGTARLPASRLGDVATACDALLRTLRPSGVVSAGAAGADLLVLAAAQSAGIPVHLVVPIGVDEFVRRSVADAGEDWVARWGTVLGTARDDRASQVLVRDVPDGDGWYLAANGVLLDVALELGAAAGEPVLALTVRPPEGEDPPSATDDFAARAAGAELVVLSMDPRPAAPAAGTHLTAAAPPGNSGDSPPPPCD